MDLTLKQLRAFAAVAETSSFTQAASQLHIAQSAISILIRELERELSVRLFDRTTRRVELTAAGQEFRPHAEKIILDLRHAIQNTYALGQLKRGLITVAAPPLLMEALIPRVLAPFKRDFPNVRIVLIDGRTERIVEAVKSGEADIGIGTFPRIGEEMLHTLLIRDVLLLFSQVDHPLAKLKQPKWCDIKNAPVIALTRDSAIRHLSDRGFQMAGILSQPEYEVALVTTALSLVEMNLGVSVLPSNALAAIRSRPIVAAPLSHPVISRKINIIARHGRSFSPAAAEWVRRLQRDVKAATGAYQGDRISNQAQETGEISFIPAGALDFASE